MNPTTTWFLGALFFLCGDIPNYKKILKLGTEEF